MSGGLSDNNRNNSDLTIATDKIIDGILNKTKSVKSINSEMSISTNDILDRIINKTNELSVNNIKHDIQKGGKGKSKKDKKDKKSKKDRHVSRIHGERTISTFSEVTSHFSDKKYDNPVDSDGSDISDIAHQIARQSSDIHERTVMKIIEILKLNKDKPEDVQKARNYKAAIYKMIKEKNPLLNNFDRAVEMEKSITKEMLNSIDINKVTKEIEKHLSEKSKTEQTPTKQTPTTSTASTESKTSKTKKVKQSRETVTSDSMTSNSMSSKSMTFSSKSNSSNMSSSS